MKALVVVVGLVLMTQISLAKITVFNNTDAVRKVVNDSELMAKINPYEKSLESISVKKVSDTEFQVGFAFANDVETTCEYDVNVEVKSKSVALPNGSKIATTELVVTGLSNLGCH